MAILTGCWIYDLAIVLISAFSTLYIFFQYSYKHWARLEIPSAETKFPLGSLGLGGFTKNIVEALDDVYNAHKKERVVGLYSMFAPILMIRDLDVVKDVLVKEFMSFHDRGMFADEELDPLSGNLFMIGGSKWKNLRAKLSPTFTSGKMKMMFHIFADQSAKLAEVLKEDIAKNDIIEVKETMARFTTDVISSAAFGIETNSLRNPDSIFRQMGKKIVEPNFANAIRGLIFNTPKLAKMFKMRIFSKELSDFFLHSVQETMDYRDKNNVKRNDFLQLLMQLKNKGEIEDVDEGKKENKENNENKTIQKFTFEQATAQAFLFFIAGFETSSTAMQFALYEMALHPDLQDKVREEVKAVLKEHNGEMTYEAIHEMKYLGRFVDETLRLFPPAAILLRECTRDYKIPDSDWVIAKGTTIQVPIYSIHRDPKYFPDPERFDPDRFTEEVKSTRHNYAYLPFGEGPRNCIGMRFGLMQVKVGLARLVMNFKIDICEKSPVPLKLNPVGGLAPKGGMYLKISELK